MIGERLKHAMEMRGIKNRELAYKTGLTEATISRYVNNLRDCNTENLIKICKELNVSSDWLLGLKGGD